MVPLAETVEILDRLIAFPTVSSDDNRALTAFAAGILERAGARVVVTSDTSGAKANIFATFGPEGNGGVVLSGHTDVVPADPSEWTSDPFVLREADGRLYGRGTCDMKGFVAAVLAMAPHFGALELNRPIHVALTYDEEVGCLGARHLVDDLRRSGLRPAAAIVGEPTGLQPIEGHKGCYEYTTRFFGTDGHGSNPDKGINAIHYASQFIGKLLEIGEQLKRGGAAGGSPFHPPWTTLQVGRITGGSARNVIARQCAVEWEMRPVRPADGHWVKAQLETYCEEQLLPHMRAVTDEARISTEIVGEVEGLEVVANNEVRDIVMTLTGNTKSEVVAFGTEAGLFQSLGMSVVICGPGSIAQAHQPDEFISRSQLEKCLVMLSNLPQYLVARA